MHVSYEDMTSYSCVYPIKSVRFEGVMLREGVDIHLEWRFSDTGQQCVVTFNIPGKKKVKSDLPWADIPRFVLAEVYVDLAELSRICENMGGQDYAREACHGVAVQKRSNIVIRNLVPEADDPEIEIILHRDGMESEVLWTASASLSDLERFLVCVD